MQFISKESKRVKKVKPTFGILGLFPVAMTMFLVFRETSVACKHEQLNEIFLRPRLYYLIINA